SASSPPGTYGITPAGLTSGNYAITFVSGTLTVLSYSQATSNLQTRVDAAGLAQGMQSSLDSQLQAAIAAFAARDTRAGVGQFQSFTTPDSATWGRRVGAGLGSAGIADARGILDAVG